jgi:hypothetical protein
MSDTCFTVPGPYFLHLQGRKISQVRNQQEAGAFRGFLVGLLVTLSVGTVRFSETCVNYRATQRYLLEDLDDSTLHSHRSHSLRSNILVHEFRWKLLKLKSQKYRFVSEISGHHDHKGNQISKQCTCKTCALHLSSYEIGTGAFPCC